jgi:hypothetical protein
VRTHVIGDRLLINDDLGRLVTVDLARGSAVTSLHEIEPPGTLETPVGAANLDQDSL